MTSTPDFAQWLESPAFNTQAPRGPQSPFTFLGNHLCQDSPLSDSALRALTYLLSLPADWDGFQLYKRIMEQLRCGKDKAYRVINELLDAGHVIRVAFKSETYGKPCLRHKVTEFARKTNNPKERIWIQNAHQQPYHTRQRAVAPTAAGYKARRPTLRGAPDAPTPGWKLKREAKAATGRPGDSARKARRAAYLPDQANTPPFPCFPESNKGRKGDYSSSSHNLIPLTPEGENSDSMLRVVGESSGVRSTGPAGPTAAAAPYTSKRQPAPERTYAPVIRNAVYSDPTRMAEFFAAFGTRLPEAAATWGRGTTRSTPLRGFRDFLSNQLTAMLQEILGIQSWDLANLRKYSRIARSRISAHDLVIFFCAYASDWGCNSSGLPRVARNIKSHVEEGQRHRRPPASDIFAHEYLTYAECLEASRRAIAAQLQGPLKLMTKRALPQFPVNADWATDVQQWLVDPSSAAPRQRPALLWIAKAMQQSPAFWIAASRIRKFPTALQPLLAGLMKQTSMAEAHAKLDADLGDVTPFLPYGGRAVEFWDDLVDFVERARDTAELASLPVILSALPWVYLEEGHASLYPIPDMPLEAIDGDVDEDGW